MRGRPFDLTFGQEDTAEKLKALYLRERDGAVRTRLHALWLLRSGWRLRPVAQAVGVHYRSVQRWVGWYRNGGVGAVRGHRVGGKGQEPFLSEEAQDQVCDEVATGRFRTAAQIREWIAHEYGVSYTLGGVYSLLKRLKCAPKVPRPLHAKADLQVQQAWKKGALSRPWLQPE